MSVMLAAVCIVCKMSTVQHNATLCFEIYNYTLQYLTLYLL